ncbi:MAG: sugar phosphate isomerase/epimerase [Sphaerobacter sp.]|nr:sugar phosphate isomerase/epimerase [Sphaerobacter sp.]
MAMDVIVSTGSLTGMSLPRIFDVARRAGADGVELMLTARLVQQGPERVRELERRFGVAVRSVHAVLRLREPSARQGAEDIVASARFARALSACETLVVHPPTVSSLHTLAASRWFDALETVRAMTDDAPTRVTIENLGRLRRSDPPSVFDHPDRLRWVAQEWGVGVTYDTAHAASRDWDVVATAGRLAPYLANLHLSDYGRRDFPVGMANALLRDHQLPGSGVLPLEALLFHLARTGYRGLVTLELSPVALGVPWRPAVERRLRGAITHCRAAIQAGALAHGPSHLLGP